MSNRRKEMTEYKIKILNEIREMQERGEETDLNRLCGYLSGQVRWKKEVDPALASAGTMDCTVWVPEKPAWDGIVVGEARGHSTLRFSVPEGERPRMGGNYVEIEPMDPFAEIFYSIIEGTKKYFDGKALPFLRQIYQIKIV